jgi:hypothetical protein
MNVDEIRIVQSRLAGLLGSLFPGLIAFMLIDHKYGNQLFEIEPLTPAWYWGSVILSLVSFYLLGQRALFPKTIFLMNEKGIEIGLGDYKRETQFIPWGKVEAITKTEVRAPGRYINDPATKKREPVMLSGVEITLSEKYQQCGPCPKAYIQGHSVFVTETRSDIETFIENLLHFKELEKGANG